jgi:O-6-methylguanine DNA methyltransferase
VADSDAVAVWTELESPFGRVWLAATARGICGVSLAPADGMAAALARRLGGRVVPEGPEAPAAARRVLERARQLLTNSFAGGADATTIPIDLTGLPDWDRRVLEGTRSIPFGQTASYGEIARRIGAPRAARAVGGALGRNPVWILVPCHRVIAGDGSLGGYGGGLGALDLKRALLASEGISVGRATDRAEARSW